METCFAEIRASLVAFAARLAVPAVITAACVPGSLCASARIRASIRIKSYVSTWSRGSSPRRVLCHVADSRAKWFARRPIDVLITSSHNVFVLAPQGRRRGVDPQPVRNISLANQGGRAVPRRTNSKVGAPGNVHCPVTCAVYCPWEPTTAPEPWTLPALHVPLGLSLPLCWMLDFGSWKLDETEEIR